MYVEKSQSNSSAIKSDITCMITADLACLFRSMMDFQDFDAFCITLAALSRLANQILIAH